MRCMSMTSLRARDFRVCRVCIVVAMLAMCFALVPRAMAGGVCSPVPPEDAALMAPESADIVIVIDGVAEIAQTPRGRGAIAILQELGLFADTAIAWSELATTLGMRPDEAIRAVAGRRVMLVATTQTPQQPTGWALLTHVEPRTERLIRERLKPVPRRIANGQPVLMLENGRFLMATRAPKGARDKSQDAALLIAPAHASDLFDATLPLLSERPAGSPISADRRAALASRTQHPRVRGLPTDAFILYRPRTGQENNAPRTLLALAASPAPQPAIGWVATVACDPAFLGDTSPGVGVPEQLFRAASEHAILAFAAPVSNARDSGSGFSRILYRFMSDVAPLFDGNALVSFRERPTGAGDRAAEIIIGSALVPAPDAPARFDAGMATLINRLSRVEPLAAEAQDFRGLFPGSVRESDLSPRALSILAPVFGASPVARWCFVPDAPESPWWLAQIAARTPNADGSVLRTVAASLAPEPDAPAITHLVTAGVIRPDALYRTLPPVMRALTPLLAPFRFTRAIEWRGTIHPDGLMRGQASIEFLSEAEQREPTPARIDSR